MEDQNVQTQENQQLKVTSIQELKAYASGEIVELPPFANGQRFFARLRRPSLLAMAKKGQIPNSLLSSASNLFQTGNVNGNVSKMDEKTLEKTFEVMDVLCEASFMEPTYKELVDNDIELTDEQYTFVFNYSQNGVKSLESFR